MERVRIDSNELDKPLIEVAKITKTLEFLSLKFAKSGFLLFNWSVSAIQYWTRTQHFCNYVQVRKLEAFGIPGD